MKHVQHIQQFRALHHASQPLILHNIWDAGSARIIAEHGVPAIATSSWAVAQAHGFDDGENMPLELALANLERIISSVSLPVSFDMEAGYSSNATGVYDVALAIIQTGVSGINIEDLCHDTADLYSIEAQCQRIAEVKRAADASGLPIFINARSDIYFRETTSKHTSEHKGAHFAAACQRLEAYADAGADGFFLPGLLDKPTLSKLCTTSPLPINIMLTEGTIDTKVWQDVGIARISRGPQLYARAMQNLARL